MTGEQKWWDLTKQDEILEEALAFVAPDKRQGAALDLGSGEGRNARFLSESGWSVTAVDRDVEALRTLHRHNPEIETIVSDVSNFLRPQESDMVICTMVLHFLQPSDVPRAVENMKQSTVPGGINVISVYTDKNPPGHRPYQFKPGELRDFYAEWELLNYKEEPTPWFQMPGEDKPRRNQAAFLIARRPE